MTDASTTSRPLFNRQQLISLFLPLVAEQALSISIIVCRQKLIIAHVIRFDTHKGS